MSVKYKLVFFGKLNLIENILEKIKVLNKEYILDINIFSSIINLYSFLSVEKVDIIFIIDSNNEITPKEIFLNIYQGNNINKSHIYFISDNENNLKELSNVFVSKNSIFLDFNKSENFILEKVNSYSNLCLEFNKEYLSGNTSDFTLPEIFLFIEKCQRSGLISFKINEDTYFDFYFREGIFSHASGKNGYCPVSKIDTLKELFKEKNYLNSSFDFLSDTSNPENNFEENISKSLSIVYQNFKINDTSQSINKNTVISYRELINKTGISFNSKEFNKKNIIINPNIKEKENNIISKKEGISMGSVNLEKAVELAEDVFWVSDRDPKSTLQVNTYLRLFRRGTSMISLAIDPGGHQVFPSVSKKISSIIKDISRVNMYSVNHQDPDVGTNGTFISKMNPKAVCLCTEETWRLFKYLGIPKETFKNVNSFHDNMVTLSTDPSHVIQFIPTPFCHFVGAFALYDRKSRMLFTGDLFGGLNPNGNMDLFATEDHWEGIKTFHQVYMPSNKVIKRAIDNIRALDEPPLMIVPQHGAILTGEIMDQFLNRLYNLDVGADLYEKSNQTQYNRIFLEIMNTAFLRFVELVGLEEVNKLFNFRNKNQELFYLVDMDENGIKGIYSDPEKALNSLLKTISNFKDHQVVSEIKSIIIRESISLPTPINFYISNEEDEYISTGNNGFDEVAVDNLFI